MSRSASAIARNAYKDCFLATKVAAALTAEGRHTDAATILRLVQHHAEAGKKLRAISGIERDAP